MSEAAFTTISEKQTKVLSDWERQNQEDEDMLKKELRTRLSNPDNFEPLMAGDRIIDPTLRHYIPAKWFKDPPHMEMACRAIGELGFSAVSTAEGVRVMLPSLGLAKGVIK